MSKARSKECVHLDEMGTRDWVRLFYNCPNGGLVRKKAKAEDVEQVA